MRPPSAPSGRRAAASGVPVRVAQRSAEASKEDEKKRLAKKSARKESASAKREATLREALQQVFGETAVTAAATNVGTSAGAAALPAVGRQLRNSSQRGIGGLLDETHDDRAVTARRSRIAATAATVVGDGDNDAPVDAYGSGSPTDRLQFGYAPAVPDEAIAYHSMISTSDWIAARRKNCQIAFVKKQKLRTPNCEPFASVLKLRRYWSRMNERLGDRLLRNGGGMTDDAADAFLDAMARAQGLPEVDELPPHETAEKPRSGEEKETTRGRDERRRKVNQL